MATGKRPNVRETCSFLAAATLFGIVASMVPAILDGQTLHFTVFKLFPGIGELGPLSISLRADALSMVFALRPRFCGW